MSNPEDDEPKQRPLFQRLSVGFQPGRNHVATGFKNRPSPLAQMMIEKGREALLNGDYAESLDNLMTIKSIEEHSDIETAIALTAMDVIERLQLDNRAQIIAPQFVSSVIALRHEAFERRANKLKMLGQIFRHKRLIALRNEANRIEAGLLSSAGNGSAHEIVSDLSKTPLLQSERGSRDIFRREVRELWSASREITAEMRHLRKLIEDHGRGWPESGETSMRIRSMHESISRIEERTLQEVASLKNSTDVLTMRQEQMRKEARLTRFVVFAILSVMLALLMLFGLVKRGLFSHVA